MAEPQKCGITAERDIEQAINALKKGAYLLKYGRRGKPKFCPFRLSNDETSLMWYSGKDEKQLKLSQVSRIIPGQRTAIFQRHPRPEKEYQSFSLICTERSLDLICKDKDEAEVWLVGLKALIGSSRKCRSDSIIGDNLGRGSSAYRGRRNSPSVAPFDSVEGQGSPPHAEVSAQTRWAKAFSDIISQTAATKTNSIADLEASSLVPASAVAPDNASGRNSASDTVRISFSSAVSSSSHGSFREDFDALTLGDVFTWGEWVGDGLLGGGEHRVGAECTRKMVSTLPRALESTVVLDVHNIACGDKHAVLVNKQGEIFSWGEGLGGRLGHGTELNVSFPKLIDALSGVSIEQVACGEYHTCAVALSGEFYTWGDGDRNIGLLGNESGTSHWIPKRVVGCLEGLHVSYIACGPWHTAAVTSSGQLFTFGDGSFGALGHGDRSSSMIPREVEALLGLRVIKVACGVWHTAAIVEMTNESSSDEPPAQHSSRNIYTWGDGDKYQLGHGDRESRLFPQAVIALIDQNICQVACGHSMTVALTAGGRVFTMGSTSYGQLGNPVADGKLPVRVEGKITSVFVEEIACGSYHVAALSSTSEVFTWGKGSKGQLGHGDFDNRNSPTLVDSLKEKQVKAVACGSNFTAVICFHKWVSSIDRTMCSGCHNQFNFRRKRHNCYNCGLVFCKACSSRKSLKASLAPNMNKPYRVCDDCYLKLNKIAESITVARMPKPRNSLARTKSSGALDREAPSFKSRRRLSRLLSIDSINLTEGRRSISDSKLEPQGGRIFTVTNQNSQMGGLRLSKDTFPMGAPMKYPSFSVPVSRKSSRPASPFSRKSSSPRTSEVNTEDSKHNNDGVTQEIMTLRAQVEDLQRELEKTTRKLKEVTEIASDEAQKCKTAKEVIKSLTAQLQLKEMAEKYPEEPKATPMSTSAAKELPSDFNMIAKDAVSPEAASPECDSDSKSVNSAVSNGSKQHNNKGEWIVQDEPGVYITLAALPSGGNELKRIRFSRKHFSEQQAEKWWSANGNKVCERHKIQNT